MTYSHRYLRYNPCSHWHYNIFHFYNRLVLHMHNPCPLQKKNRIKSSFRYLLATISLDTKCVFNILIIPIQHLKCVKIPLTHSWPNTKSVSRSHSWPSTKCVSISLLTPKKHKRCVNLTPDIKYKKCVSTTPDTKCVNSTPDTKYLCISQRYCYSCHRITWKLMSLTFEIHTLFWSGCHGNGTSPLDWLNTGTDVTI